MIIDDDAVLVMRWQAGDESAFTLVVERYQKRVMAVAYRMLFNRAEAEEAAQEAFFRLYRAKYRYRPSAKFSSYLFTIVHRICLNVLRRRKHAMVSLDSITTDASTGGAPQWTDPKATPPAQTLDTRERSDLVVEAIGRLSPEERMAVVLDYWEDMSFESIGAVLHKSVPAVKSLLFRARGKLKAQLQSAICA